MAASAKQVDRLASKSLICDPVRSPTRWRYPISGAPYVSTWFTGWENYAGDSAILLIHVPTGGTTGIPSPASIPSHFNPRASRGHDSYVFAYVFNWDQKFILIFIIGKKRFDPVIFLLTFPRKLLVSIPLIHQLQLNNHQQKMVSQYSFLLLMSYEPLLKNTVHSSSYVSTILL